MRYRTIVADPPWPYGSPGSGPLSASPTHRPNSWESPLNHAGSVKRYGKMSLAEIGRSLESAHEMADPDGAHLFLWCTNAFVGDAHRLLCSAAWRPVTMLTWVKTKPDGCSPSMKTGYYFRGATEHVHFALRGSLPLATDAALPTAYLWPRLPHSVKPDAFYDLVEQASPGPYLELFARRQRLGWDTWGDEALCHVEMGA